MKPTPYNTGKIKIGGDYFPPIKPRTMSDGEELIQKALIDGADVSGKNDLAYWVAVVVIALAAYFGLFGPIPGAE